MTTINRDFDLEKASRVLSRFFKLAVMAGLDTPAEEVRVGHPMRGLISEALNNGVQALATELLKAYPNMGSYALNGNGLKVRWIWSDDNQKEPRLLLVVTSDHGAAYDITVARLNLLIKNNRWADPDEK